MDRHISTPVFRVPHGTKRAAAVGYPFIPYFIVGLAICLIAQLVFWFRVGDVGILAWPFVWSYSQAAMLEVILGGARRPIYAATWAACYLGLSLLLWLAVERFRVRHQGIWARALVTWCVAQAIVTALALILASRQVIKME